MLNPLSLAPGVIVDMRIVMIICAILLSGWRAGIVAVFIIAAYRISLGGSGATAGVVTLISTFIIISLYDLRHGNATERPIEAASVTIGVVLFNQALGYMLLPEAVRIPFLQNTTLPFLLLYPLATSTVLMIVQRRDHYLSLLDKLQQSEQRFRAIFDQTFQFIGLLKPDGTLIEANKTALSFAGVTLDEIAGKPYWETRWWTVNKETQEELRAAIRRASNGEFVRYEVEVLGHNDQTVTIDFSLNPIKNEHGKVVMIIPEGRDISDQLVARQREIDLQMEQESSHLMREFIAHSAHHLRTPITVVKSTLFVCQKRLDQFIADIEATTEIH
ncbi:MAG: LytS/YhcK type 5TM receptor domain-containing protein, partial [Chloroflexota bacterium]